MLRRSRSRCPRRNPVINHRQPLSRSTAAPIGRRPSRGCRGAAAEEGSGGCRASRSGSARSVRSAGSTAGSKAGDGQKEKPPRRPFRYTVGASLLLLWEAIPNTPCSSSGAMSRYFYHGTATGVKPFFLANAWQPAARVSWGADVLAGTARFIHHRQIETDRPVSPDYRLGIAGLVK